jgi:hypothetical protein
MNVNQEAMEAIQEKAQANQWKTDVIQEKRRPVKK